MSNSENSGHFTAVLENIASQVALIAENQLQMETRFNAKLESLRTDLKGDIHLLSQAVSLNSQGIQRLDKRIDNVEQRLDGVEGRLNGVEGRLNGVEERLSGVEGRLDRIEVKMDRVADKVGTHDGAIRKLKQRTRH